jgi:pimeloyl-ACP methyl ester carboxylesterase
MTAPIAFLHGLFMTPSSWQPWVDKFVAAGRPCHALAYPYHDGPPAALRADPPTGLGALRFADVEAHLAAEIDALDAVPVVVGHSMGGLLAQRMVATGKAAAAVCISSAAPKGVSYLSWSFLRCNLPVVNPLRGSSVFTPSAKWWRRAMANVQSPADATAQFEAHAVPESRNVPRSASTAHVDFAAPHVPMLFISGSADQIVPAAWNRKNVARYARSGQPVEHFTFDGKDHSLCLSAGWEAVADYVMRWIDQVDSGTH